MGLVDLAHQPSLALWSSVEVRHAWAVFSCLAADKACPGGQRLYVSRRDVYETTGYAAWLDPLNTPADP